MTTFGKNDLLVIIGKKGEVKFAKDLENQIKIFHKRILFMF